ncbi:MAG: beta-ketoacyl synthase N-terminal-like domain-containing protein [Candidatus Thermoplasmatota archaeon]|nr:beta-ketoacyl synthase N-terminal-like domain-containing protein [Candidatus Thermoplasmatota archaeon]MEC8609483.1 beta-ketoacyl synthase N-terminal-like domain-containing protein [Candidatus Thermoplasmatota archaeon]
MSLTTDDGKPCEGLEQGPFEPIAVIGLAAMMPDAEDLQSFWQNIIDSHVSIKEIREGRWPGPVDHFWMEGTPGDVAHGYTYAKIGAFIEGYEFDWRRWRQPPGTIPQIDPCQLWAVSVSAAAIEQAGYGEGEKEFPRERAGVVFANALGGENRNMSNIRVWSNHTAELAKSHGMPSSSKEAFMDAMNEHSPKVDEDTMPGELANVVSGRVANLLDLQGPNHAMDAACASSMAAVMDACRLLQTRQADVMLAGATDRTMDPATYAKFSAIGALSPTHSTPFDARANGFVMGEGAGVMVLKRLRDAIADDDTIHAVIRGIGGSSDGRGKGITAPSQRGQIQAIARAYNQAGYPASTVELVEAHGTSTKVGDATELSTLTRLWTDAASGDNVAVGSIKSQIGHLKAAAGIAGIIKSVMALHHRTIPPSAGFETPNPTVDWKNIPFFVPTSPLEWPNPESHPRRAGVSAFGFGGTNFHIALEGYEPDYHRSMAEDWQQRWNAYSKSTSNSAPSILDSSAKASLTHEELRAIEGGLLLLSGSSIDELVSQLDSISFNGPNFDDDPRGVRLSVELQSASTSFDQNQTCRFALIATSWSEFEKRKALALKSLADPQKWGFLQAQGILVSDQPPMPSEAKIAHMYPGQGSQYVGMTFDLHQRYTPVQEVWKASDSTMVEVLDGETLSSFVLRSGLSDDERQTAEHKLKQTEYTQPAMLTADLAIEHALNAYGHKPDMVAGHSLGEYAALMVSGILNMDGALRAAAARGTEMGSVEIDDKGLMASVTAPYEDVERILEAESGYVIAANKNSPKMTVIAGETEAVQNAMKAFENEGFNCVPLATSHAFHSSIVAPANEPLYRFLSSLEINWPSIPITANVDGTFYPSDGPDASEGILSKLAPQMASSVEWTSQINTMYEAGARIFLEVGPKRALTMFASQILENHPHLALMTNHPKQGGIASFLTAIGGLAVAGRPPNIIEGTSTIFTEAFRAGPIEAHQEYSLPKRESEEDLRIRARPLPGRGGGEKPSVETFVAPSTSQKQPTIADYVGDRIAQHCGYPALFCQGMVNLRLGLGLSEQSIQSIIASIGSEAQTDAEIDIHSATTAADIERWVQQTPSGWMPRVHLAKSTSHPTVQQSVQDPVAQRRADPYVVTGISLGLPGGKKVFDEDVFERLVRGETCLEEVSDEYKQRLLDKNITRLIKGRDGSVNMEQATTFGDIPQLAGVKGAFDLAEEFGIDPKMVLAWDITTQLAMASGLLALRDAGIPLTPEEQTGKGGLRLIRNWQVPSVHRDRTGIVFASCFSGLQMAMKHAKSDGDDGEGKFDRRYLFQVLTMGHSQFAQFTGIRGPTTTINLACASATGAFQIAEDWLAADRVDRVIILSADDVTGDDLWEWIGSGFASTGAASTSNNIEEAALPFDKRRNGLVLGMGAASFVVERKSSADERGVQPIAELLGAKTANSAYHGTRLDVEHVAHTVDEFIGEMENKWGLDRHSIAKDLVFYSHETYTPARGGSAQSEVRALRETFGESTDSMVIANTKGFTGHPMGVGIEDASMFYGLLTKRIPPIANHKVIDEELGNLQLSKGGDYPNLSYGLRFAAGFGSQIGLSFVRAWPIEGERIDGKRLLTWCRNLSGSHNIQLRLLNNKLVAYVDGDENLHGGIQGDVYEITAQYEGQEIEDTEINQPIPEPLVPEPEPEKSTKEIFPEPDLSHAPVSGDMVQTVIDVVVKHTGYPADFVELDQDLEGELGIDTVKQAEIMVDIRQQFNLPVDESFVLSEHPTLNHMIGYIQKMQGGEVVPVSSSPVVEPESPSPASVVETSVAESTEVSAPVSDENMTQQVIDVVVKHTGYPADFIELDQDLEGELGIDTVKQAEIMVDIREQFNLPVDEDFLLSEHPTLNHMIGYIVHMKGGSPTATASPVVSEPTTEQTPEPTETPVVSLVKDAGIEASLVEVVVKHTGYPADFIEMDQDLEGELGIDTVKQAEIMVDVREIFSLPVDEDFLLSEHPTLNHFVAYIVKMKGGTVEEGNSSSVEIPEEPAKVESKVSVEQEGCRRWQVEVEEAETLSSTLTLDGTVVVTDDGWGIAEHLCSRLEARGLSTVRVGFEVGIRDVSIQSEQGRTVHRGDPANPEHIESITTALSTMNVVGLLHLAPMKLASVSWSEDTVPSAQISLAAHGWFGLLKGMDSQMAGLSQGIVASVTAMDGRHGNIGERFNAIQCGASGVTKSYAFERPNLRARALDLHPELIFDAESAAEYIEIELFERGGDVEIGLDRDGRRWLLAAFAEDVVDELEPLKSDDVWLVSGGGSGVTAACIVGVAEASQDANASFHLLGRSVLIEQTAEWLDWGEEDLMKEKMALRERLADASSNGKVTMVEWNNAWQKFTRSMDVYKTLSQIESTGNRAFYHSIDVTDVEALSSLGASLSNPITGVVHGAGLEDSKLVSDKAWETFDKVVRVKIDGWSALMGAVRASNGELRFASVFTSVAGRFGNGGQTDYAAANSILDAEMARLTAKGTCRAVAIGWTGWRDVGMATRGSIEAVFEAAGIETLPVDIGVQIFVDEALRGGKRRVIACGSLGMMDRFDAFREAPLMLPADMAAVMADPCRFPFIDKVLEFDELEMVMTQSTLSVADHPFLSDHAIDGVPYHPGVMAMEMFAENALLLCPDSCLAGFEDVKFGLPVKIMKGTMRVRIVASVERSEGDLTWVKCRLVSDLTNSEGIVFGEREHHEAMVRLVKKSDDLSSFLQSEIAQLPAIGTPPSGRLEHHASFIYLRYFHGPRFQSHGGVLRGVGDASQPGVDGVALMRHQLPATDQFALEREGESVLLEALPMLIEAGFQNAGLVAMESEGFSSLPVGIEWSTLLRVPEKDEQLRLRSIRSASEDAGVTVHDVIVVGSDDAPVLALKGLRLKAMAPVPEDQKFTLDR